MARFGSPQRRPIKPLPEDEERKIIITARVEPALKAKALAAAHELGISLSALLAELIERLEVDETGHPGWESKYAPADDAQPTLEMSA
jgi:hypothetical protein